MKFTLSWLKEHLDTTSGLDEIVETLTRVGLEVEEVVDPAVNLKGFVTAKIVKKDKHPDADKLSLLTVDTGEEKFQVVCGAPNCREGMVGVFAKAGTTIPQYGEELKVGKIRGVESFGMMCSEKELCLSDSHDGIIELQDDVLVGQDVASVYGIDPVIEISVTPNRPDCLGVRGIARDLAAAGLGILKPLKIKETPAKFESPVRIKVLDVEACPTYVGRYIRGVNNKAETPKWMKDRLSAIGCKSISPLVDVTNYINFDLSRPLHVFDAKKLKGSLVIRMAKEGEKFNSLEDKVYELDDRCLGICDDDGVECLAGIMGGLEKGCTVETQDVLLECAMFKPEVISRTGRKYNIESDSRYRYERGIAPDTNRLGSDYATQMILEICGGEASDVMVEGKDEWVGAEVCVTSSRIERLVGMKVSESEIVETLSKLGFTVSVEADKVKVVTPSWRGDVTIENDVIEEVVRMKGLDSIPAVSLPVENLPKEVLTYSQRRVVDAKHKLAARGMLETVTWSFTDSNIGQYFRKANEVIMLSNPIAADLDEMRQSVLPNLLLGVKNNVARGYPDVSLFEIGPEFFGAKPCEQKLVAAGVRSGKVGKKSWIGEFREFDLFDVKADVLAITEMDNAQITLDAPKYYHPGRSGAMRLGKNVIAYFGEIHPSILKKMGIKQRVSVFEVYMDNIPVPRGVAAKAKKKLELSQFQPVDKDLAFVLDRDVQALAVIAAARNADKDNIVDVRVFDVYEGSNMLEGKKSVAISVTFQPREKTYTDQELDILMKKVVEAVKAKTGGMLRDGE